MPVAVVDADFPEFNPKEIALGQLLFWDPILSGNKNISCGTCHHPRFGTADGVPLALGEGGIGLGPKRVGDPENFPESRVPRNAPALFNLGAMEYVTMFHDGRVELDPSKPNGVRTPMGADILTGFSSALSAQAMFPVMSGDEMAGQFEENDVSLASRQGRISGDDGVWDILSARVAAIPEYQTGFADLGIPTPQFTDIANAIAAFISFEWRSDNSAFDQYLRGEAGLGDAASAGMALFYGEAGCVTCHSGKFQTDHEFHAMGVPQFGPGKAASFENHARDVGRMLVTGLASDAYRFRTPSLRNVTSTAPYGHNGAYSDLIAFLDAHISPAEAVMEFDRAQINLPDLPGANDWQSYDNSDDAAAISAAATTWNVTLAASEMSAILAFLQSLADEDAIAGRLGIPEAVPSGLAVDR